MSIPGRSRHTGPLPHTGDRPACTAARMSARYSRVVKVRLDGVDPSHPLLRQYETEAREAGLNSAQATRMLTFVRKVAPP